MGNNQGYGEGLVDIMSIPSLAWKGEEKNILKINVDIAISSTEFVPVSFSYFLLFKFRNFQTVSTWILSLLILIVFNLIFKLLFS